MTIIENLLAALYTSDVWYQAWQRTNKLQYKARAVVTYDKVLNKEFHRMKEPV